MLDQFASFGCAGNSGYVGNKTSKQFPLPYLDYTSTAVPASFSELLDWSEYVYTMGDTRELFKRLFSYFVTDLRFRSIDPDTKVLDDRDAKAWRAQIEEKLCWPVAGAGLLDNVGCYGNDFISVVAPVTRFLRCHHCGRVQKLVDIAKTAGANFGYTGGEFVARCQSPVCKKLHPEVKAMKVHDIRDTSADKFTIKHWPVREIVLYHYLWTDETHIHWKVPEEYKRAVASGDIYTLATADLGVLDAIRKNTLFKFRDDRVYHAKEPVLSGLKTRGWGLPRTLYMCRQAWTLQLVRKQIQALGIDFVTPLRLLSPSTQPVQVGSGYAINPSTSVNHSDFSRAMSRILAAHRRDPTGIHSAQVPVDYRVMGGEANQLFPADLHATAKEDFLDAGGFPVNIYKADLTLQTAPVGLRLFEAQNRSIVSILNGAVRFVVSRVSELSGRDPVDVAHKRVTLVDNIENTLIRVQMATSGQLSMAEALEPLGVDLRDDLQQQKAEQLLRSEMAEELEDADLNKQKGYEQLQMAAQGQQGGGGGAAAQPDPLAGQLPSTGLVIATDIDGMQQQATALAAVLAQIGPNTPQRQSELQLLRDQNPTFHSLVMQALPQADSSFQQQAAAQMMQAQPAA